MMRTALACLLMLLLCAPASAVELVKLLNTGYDNATGNVIWSGLPDPDYTVTPGGLMAYVPPSIPSPPWLANSPASKWIGWNTGSSVTGPGDYDFTTTVSLGGLDPATTRFVGRWTTDNSGLDILINGASTGATTTGGFGNWHLFGPLGAGLFQAGENTVTFRFNNAGDDPGGLRVEGGVFHYTGLPDSFDFEIYNTGVDDDSVPLADDAVDPHWTLSGSDATAGQGPEAYAATGVAWPVADGVWLGDLDDPESTWICPSTDTNGPTGLPGQSSIYAYSTTFTTPKSGVVTLTGMHSVDGNLAGFDVDGIAGSFSPVGFNAFGGFSIVADVTGTEHTLTFFADNGFTDDGRLDPTGLRVNFFTAEFVPEPSTLVLVTIGLLGLGLYGWRRKRTA